MKECCDLDHYRDGLSGETVYENKSICIKKLDDKIYLYFNNPADKHCMWLKFDKGTAVEFSEKIIESLKG